MIRKRKNRMIVINRIRNQCILVMIVYIIVHEIHTTISICKFLDLYIICYSIIIIMNSSNKITLTCIKELTYHNEPVYNLLLLHDGRLATCSNDHTIKVVSLKPYHCDISTKAHSARVTYISQMGNGALLSCSEDKTVKLWSIGKSHLVQKKEMKPHNTCIYKVIQIKENIIATCSADLSVKLSDIDKCKEIYTFPKTQEYVKNIYYIKKRKLLVIPDYQLLRLYDIDSYEEKVKISFYGIINYMNSIYEINDTFLVFGDYNIKDKDNLLYIYTWTQIKLNRL